MATTVTAGSVPRPSVIALTDKLPLSCFDGVGRLWKIAEESRSGRRLAATLTGTVSFVKHTKSHAAQPIRD